MVNTKNFMTVLHEEEMLDDASLDSLKGGSCFINICPQNVCDINCGSNNPDECEEYEPEPEPEPEPDPEEPEVPV